MAEVGNLQVNIGLNSSGFQQGITNINRQLKVAQAEFRNASSAIGNFGNSTEQLRAKSNYLNQSVGLQQQKVEELRRAYEASVQATGEDSRATQNLAVQYNNAQARLNNLQRQLTDTNERIRTQESRWTQLGTRLSTIGSKMQAVGKKMQDIGGSLTTKVTAPIVGLGTAAAKMSIDFENSLAKVGTIVDTTKISMENVKKGVLDLSNQTGQGVNELNEALYQSISAGVDSGKSVEFLGNAVKLAKGGFTDTSSSVDLLTTILNGYKLKAEETANVSDILINTQNLGKTSVNELSSSMGKVVPIANSANVNLKQLSSAYVLLTQKGIATAEAGTYVRSMLSELSKSGSKTDKALREMTGKSFAELQKSGKSTGDVLNILSQYASKNGLTLKDMFGSVEAGTASMILAGNSGKDFNDVLSKMNNTAGATDTAFNKVNDTAGAKLQKSFNSLKNAGIQLGDSLAPIIEKISSAIQTLASKFSSLTPAQQETIVKVGLLVAAIGPVILTIGKLISIGGTLVSAFGTISTAVGSAGGVIALLTSPIGIAIGAITAIIAIGVALYKNWDTIKAKAEELKKNVSKAWDDLGKKTDKFLKDIKESISKTWDNIRTSISNTINNIKSTIENTFNKIKSSIDTIFNNIKTSITNTINSIKTTITNVFNSIKTTTENIFNGIKKFLTTIWNGYKSLITLEINAIKTVITTVWNAIKSVTQTVWNGIKSYLTSLWNTYKNIFTSGSNAIKSVVTTVWNAIKTAIETPVNKAKDTVKRTLDTIKGFFSSLKIPEIKIPKIKLPHFNLTGSFSLNPPSVPKLGVNWYDKGAIFDRPSIIGVGEKRPEFVGALDDLRYLIRDELNNNKNGGNGSTLNVTIENFVNNRKQDVQSFAEELEFYRKQNSLSRGGAY